MRMWMVDPKLLCRKHLLGEHGEIHKHRHNFVKKHRIDGRLHPVVQIEPKSMERRHDDLASDMIRRSFNHNSPYSLPDISHVIEKYGDIEVDINKSLEDLRNRCPECSSRIDKVIG
jgi:hypothetical protein